MTSDYEPIWKELPLPSEQDHQLYEEWKKQQEKKEREDQDGSGVVIVIEL